MRNIFPKFEFHYTYLIMALGFVLVGYYKNLLIFTSIIVIHELGHYIIAKILKFNVVKIIIYPYGGLVKIEDNINKSSNDELLVASSGVVFQSLYYLLFMFLAKYNFFNDYTISLFKSYHFSILFFNMLPIINLDGFKILNIILNKFFSYRKSNIISVYLSLFFLIILLFFIKDNFNYTYIFILSIVLKNIYVFYNELEYLFNKFLLERYLFGYSFDKTKIINNYKDMYKDYQHIIKCNKKYIKERDFLRKMFDRS